MTAPLALYLHWPFCLSKCPYCDFNSHVLMADEPRFVQALLREMGFWAGRLPPRPLRSLFFGGGTPSLLSPASVAQLIEGAARHWPPVPGCEITLEANPTSSEAEKFRGFRAAGVNRLSLGVQALDDAALQALGRKHTVAEALSALKTAQRIFPRTSFDLIYARAGQSVADWEGELRRALELAQGHLSLYQLTIEPGTVFAGQAAGGREHRADDDDAADMYALTDALCTAAGLPAYEVSNHAAPGQECRHNLAYWQYEDYLGIGAGAHGRIFLDGKKVATATHRRPQDWLRATEETGHGMDVFTPLSPAEMRDEALLMGLRLVRGIDKKSWHEKCGQPLDGALNPAAKKACLAAGLLEEDEKALRATAEGRLKLTSLTAALSA